MITHMRACKACSLVLRRNPGLTGNISAVVRIKKARGWENV